MCNESNKVKEGIQDDVQLVSAEQLSGGSLREKLEKYKYYKPIDKHDAAEMLDIFDRDSDYISLKCLPGPDERSVKEHLTVYGCLYRSHDSIRELNRREVRRLRAEIRKHRPSMSFVYFALKVSCEDEHSAKQCIMRSLEQIERESAKLTFDGMPVNVGSFLINVTTCNNLLFYNLVSKEAKRSNCNLIPAMVVVRLHTNPIFAHYTAMGELYSDQEALIVQRMFSLRCAEVGLVDETPQDLSDI